MSVEVIKTYFDKELDRRVLSGEKLELTEERAKVLIRKRLVKFVDLQTDVESKESSPKEEEQPKAKKATPSKGEAKSKGNKKASPKTGKKGK